MIPIRRALRGLALSYQLLGTSLTARLVALRPGRVDAVRTRTLLAGQRRASIVPALRGFLAEPLDTQLLHTIEAPALILTQPADALHPLRSGEILYDLLPRAELCVAPSNTFWDSNLDATADLIAAFVHGRDGFAETFAVQGLKNRPARRSRKSAVRGRMPESSASAHDAPVAALPAGRRSSARLRLTRDGSAAQGPRLTGDAATDKMRDDDPH